MSDRFENVKVGDKLMKLVSADIKTYGKRAYFKSFYIEVKVERVTKTQMVVDGARYKKNGVMIGGGFDRDLFCKGETVRRDFGLKESKIPTKCQLNEYSEYVNKLSKVVRSYEIYVITKCQNLDDALAVSELIRQIESIVNK